MWLLPGFCDMSHTRNWLRFQTTFLSSSETTAITSCSRASKYPLADRFLLLNYLRILEFAEDDYDLTMDEVDNLAPGLLAARDKLSFRHFQSQTAQVPRTNSVDDHSGYCCTAIVENGRCCFSPAKRGTTCNVRAHHSENADSLCFALGPTANTAGLTMEPEDLEGFLKQLIVIPVHPCIFSWGKGMCKSLQDCATGVLSRAWNGFPPMLPVPSQPSSALKCRDREAEARAMKGGAGHLRDEAGDAFKLTPGSTARALGGAMGQPAPPAVEFAGLGVAGSTVDALEAKIRELERQRAALEAQSLRGGSRAGAAPERLPPSGSEPLPALPESSQLGALISAAVQGALTPLAKRLDSMERSSASPTGGMSPSSTLVLFAKSARGTYASAEGRDPEGLMHGDEGHYWNMGHVTDHDYNGAAQTVTGKKTGTFSVTQRRRSRLMKTPELTLAPEYQAFSQDNGYYTNYPDVTVHERYLHRSFADLLVAYKQRLTVRPCGDDEDQAQRYHLTTLGRMVLVLGMKDALMRPLVGVAQSWEEVYELLRDIETSDWNAMLPQPVADGIDLQVTDFMLSHENDISLDLRLRPEFQALVKRAISMYGHLHPPGRRMHGSPRYTAGRTAGGNAGGGGAPGGGSGGQRGNQRGDTNKQPSRCSLCGGTACGGYFGPEYLCKNAITNECNACKAAGFPGLFHARAGPRAIVNGKLVTCEQVRKMAKKPLVAPKVFKEDDKKE